MYWQQVVAKLSFKKRWPRIEALLVLHRQGWTNRQIAQEMGVHHATIGYHMKTLGLSPNGYGPKTIKMVNETDAECSKCFLVSDASNFQTHRRTNYPPYKSSYCNFCMKKRAKRWRVRDIATFMQDRLTRLRARCRKSGAVCNVTREELIKQFEYQKGRCFYTDEPMDWDGSGLRPNSLSFDRVMPHLGYTKTNIVFCLNRINTIKHNVTPSEMEMWMPEWHARALAFHQESAWQVIEKAIGAPRDTLDLWKTEGNMRVVQKWRDLGLTCFQVNEGPPEKRVITTAG